MKRVRVLVTGYVQGVSYRWSAQREALHLGLSGWVRNLDSGHVEANAQGDATAVDAFVAWCWKGPPAAEVEHVDVTELPLEDDGGRFGIRH